MDLTPLRTFDDTPTTLALISPTSEADGLAVWEVRVLAIGVGGTHPGADTERAAYIRTFAVKQTGGKTAPDGTVLVEGTVSLVGSVASTFTAEDVSGWNCAISVSDGSVHVTVTGADNTKIDWYLQHAGPLLSTAPVLFQPGKGPGLPPHPAIPVGCGWSV